MKKKQLSPKAIRLLQRVKRAILAEPKQFQMNAWFKIEPTTIPNCGTAACIGGWLITLASKKKRNPLQAIKQNRFTLETNRVFLKSAERISRKLSAMLNLPLESQRLKLTNFNYWPKQFCNICEEGTLEYAKQAARRIDHFIKTDGQE